MVDEDATAEERRLLREHGVDPEDPRLDQEIRRLEAGATADEPYGKPGAPLSRRSPFHVAVQASAGVAVVVVLATVAYVVRGILVAVLVALFLAVGLSPAVEWLRRRGVPHVAALTLISVAVVGVALATVLAALPALVRQGSELRERLPEYTAQVVRDNPTLARIDARVGIVERVRETAEDAGTGLIEGRQTQVVMGIAMSVARGVAGVVIVLVMTLYFLANLRGMKRAAYQVVPRSRRARVTLLADDMLDRIGWYVLGNIATSAIAGITAGIVLAVLGVPYAAALGLFVGLTDLIPLVGATIGAVVSCLVALTVGPGTALLAGAFFVIYQQIENFVLVPRVMRHAVDVSPAATIVAVLIGGALLGIVGALLAVPIAAAVQLVFTHVVMPRQQTL